MEGSDRSVKYLGDDQRDSQKEKKQLFYALLWLPFVTHGEKPGVRVQKLKFDGFRQEKITRNPRIS